ncbi:hypothetical protein EBU71_18720 [bacterium]|nr:hypothetical protein [Candidatus Elulimicrobium humile]
MNVANELLKKIDVQRGTSENRAIQRTREYLDCQPNPLKTANLIMSKFDIPAIDNIKKAYVFVMTAVEQSMKSETPDIQTIMQKANSRINRITDIIGPAAFVVEKEDNVNKAAPGSRKGSKREIAKTIYLENKESKSDKEIIALISTELEVTLQNAYTYLYNVKKLLDK